MGEFSGMGVLMGNFAEKNIMRNRHARINNLKHLETYRKELRNNSTEAERMLWKYIRNGKLGKKIRRQFSIGNYILDFYCFEEKLAIELDGKHHYTPEGIHNDAQRDAFLNAKGIKVLRFENRRIFHELLDVLKEISANLTPLSPPRGEVTQ
jgi:very-short-patch-repair endonuclease